MDKNNNTATIFSVSTRVPECQKIKKGGLDQYGPEHFEVKPLDITGLKMVNKSDNSYIKWTISHRYVESG